MNNQLMKLKQTLQIFGCILLCNTAQAQTVEGLKEINGTQLFISEVGKGEPLIIIHGGPGLNQEYFKPHLDPLTKKFKLVYYDQRACGQSTVPLPDSLSLAFFIDDIEAIRKSLGVEKVNLLAHSWGAMLAVNYGIKYPQHVEKMILSNPIALNLEYQAASMKMLQSKTTKQDSIDRATIIASEAFKTKQVSSVEALMKIVFRASFNDRAKIDALDIHLPANYFAATNALYQGLGKDLQSYDYYENIKAFSFPVLVLAGKADNIPQEAIERTANNVSRSTFIMFKQSGHFPFIEEQTLFVKQITRFLKK